MKTKICAKCKKELPATREYFFKCTKAKYGLGSYCKKCAVSYSMNRSKTKRPHCRKIYKDWRRKKKEEYVKKKGGKCQICGYDRCLAALDFHHTNPKLKRNDLGTGSNILRLPRNEVEEELKKCILVCSNCHREIHHI